MTQFRRFFCPVLLALTLVVSATFPATSAIATEGAQPLVTIRFNQPQVYFDKQLYGAIAKALAIKPDVLFDVVSFAPEGANAEATKKWQAVAGRNTRSVIEAMKGMGVPMDRISVTGQSQAGLRYDETQVFVH
jgi:hypothetical protein